MPTYEYRCEQGHTFEVVQRMTDDTLTSCSTCAAPVQRVFHPVAVHFKGSGFYTTDYGKKKKAGTGASEGDSKAGSKSDSKSESKSDSGGGDSSSGSGSGKDSSSGSKSSSSSSSSSSD
ncbi:MAG: FmdB family zinc ribbon protein [Thermoleophilaceae bacterium]